MRKDKKIKIVYGNEMERTTTTLGKLRLKQAILKLLETKEVEKVEVFYKDKEPQSRSGSTN